MKAIILARVSTEDQIKSGQSIPAQLAKSREYCLRKGFQIKTEYQFDESSTKDKRTKFEQVVKEIRESKEKLALIIETIDRLQRSFKESVTLDEYRKKDILEIHFLRENLIISSESNSSDLLRWDMGVMFARSYVLQLSDNVKRSIQQSIRDGRWPGRPPFGYVNCEGENGKRDIKTDPLNSKIVKMIYDLYASRNHSFQSILKKIHDDYKIKFSNGNISMILGNTFYYGLMLHKGKYYPHRYEKIIDKALFDQVQEVRAGFNKNKRKIVALPAIYRGKLFCATCGCAVSPEYHKGRFYYQCTESKGKHGASMLSEPKINDQISQLFGKLQLPKEVADDVLMTLKSVHKGKVEFREEHSRKLHKDLETYTSRKERLLTAYLDKRITDNEYDKLKAEYDNKVADLNIQVESLGQAEDSYYSTIEQVINLTSRAKEIFDSSESEQKRLLVGLTLSNLKLDGKNVVTDWIKPFNLIAKYNDHTLGLPRVDSNHGPFA